MSENGYCASGGGTQLYFGRLKQEDGQFEASLCHVVRVGLKITKTKKELCI